ncbi:hypothetical protein OPV22_009591 [Ensete ventricosum]|uniref:Uncharacterized protein n=1 Tax=Ensete ventricosum TaxID=4639 RepID=A0AAV8RB58_ENSVE|nr:hypothetical protein OPV22_009591 [Ensete ventricosum]
MLGHASTCDWRIRSSTANSHPNFNLHRYFLNQRSRFSILVFFREECRYNFPSPETSRGALHFGSFEISGAATGRKVSDSLFKAGELGFRFYAYIVSNMATGKIIGAVVASFAVAYACDVLIADKKIFGGTTPRTVTDEWWEATDKKFQAWPRTAGPPVVMNPISRQNFIVKSSES